MDEHWKWMEIDWLNVHQPLDFFFLWKWMIILTAHEIDWLNHPATNWMIRCWKVAEPADPGSTLGRLEAAIRCGFSLFSQIHTCLNRGNTEHPQVSLIMCYLLTIVTIVTTPGLCCKKVKYYMFWRRCCQLSQSLWTRTDFKPRQQQFQRFSGSKLQELRRLESDCYVAIYLGYLMNMIDSTKMMF